MKKLLGLFLIGAFLSMGAHAQKRTGIEVPAAVKTAFAQQFPGETARWAKTANQYEARFGHRRQERSAVFNADGTLAETAIELKVGQLPLPVRDYMQQHYGRSAIIEAARVTKANGTINYRACVKGRDVRFDASCTCLTEQGQPVSKF